MEEHSFIVDMSGIQIGPYCGTMSELTRVSSMDDIPGFMNDVPGFTRSKCDSQCLGECMNGNCNCNENENALPVSYLSHMYNVVKGYLFGTADDEEIYENDGNMLTWYWM